MAYLTDKEKRLLFSALSREKEICKQVDKECFREPYEETLESVVESLERKFYYDRFEKEIRNKAIDEFAERLKEKAEHESIGTHFPDGLYGEVVEVGELKNMIEKIAEEMRGAE